MKILLAGGESLVLTHIALALLQYGYDVIIVEHSKDGAYVGIDRVEKFTGKCIKKYKFDTNNKNSLRRIFGENHIDCIIYFTELNSVGESIEQPIKYYRNNIDAALSLIECMQGFSVNNLVFSSSATVYGEQSCFPFTESMKRWNCTNPYSWTKFMIEQMIEDTVKACPEMSVVSLRCFNTVGAHESVLIGFNDNCIPNNLLSNVAQVAVGNIEKLTVFGGDYDTPDGTCRRDYIHITDVVYAHLKAVEYAVKHKGVEVFNVGTGTPYSVLELIKTFENVNDVKINYEIGLRRAGDLPEVWANVDKAGKELGWRSTKSLEDMCRDAWNWQINNPY